MKRKSVGRLSDHLTLDKERCRRVLQKCVFSDVEFESFHIREESNCPVVLSEVTFDRCSVKTGTCVIRQGAVLRDVLFREFECEDAIHIASEVDLLNVKIVGSRKPGMVWIKPQISDVKRCRDTRCNLDISAYEGSVDITGVSIDEITLNHENQVVVFSDWLTSVDWKGLGISKLSYWRLMAKKVKVSGSIAGVFSFPKESSKRYQQTLDEFRILKRERITGS